MKLNLKDPKLLIPLFLGIIATWLVASSATNLLDTYLGMGDLSKLAIGTGLLLLGVVSLR